MDRSPSLTSIACLLTCALPLFACLEPNPNATDAGDTDGSGTTEGGPSCDPCELSFEVVNWNANSGSASGSVPKPDQPYTVALALIDEYAPGSAESFGYAIEWTESSGAWEFDVTVTGASNNSHLRGRAIVLGFATEPTITDIQVSGADGCQSAAIDGGLTIIDAVERYEPGGAAELSYARSSPSGDMIEYCVTASSTPEASIGVKLIGFEPPDNTSADEVDEATLASQAPQSSSFPQVDGFEILHLLSARSFDEGAAANLGYAIDCADTAAPWTCNYDMLGFKAGAEVVVGGVIVAIQ